MADEMSIEGKVLDASAIVAAPEALAALTRLVDTAGKYVAIHEESNSQDLWIGVSRDLLIAS